MAIYDQPKKCPYCEYMINYPDSKMDDKNYCPNCFNRIIYSVDLGVLDNYFWSKPSKGYGAMDELTKKQNNGEY